MFAHVIAIVLLKHGAVVASSLSFVSVLLAGACLALLSGMEDCGNPTIIFAHSTSAWTPIGGQLFGG